MLTGSPPYTGPTPDAILRQVVDGPPRPIKDLNPQASADLVRIAECCMARELRDRYASMKDVIADLGRLGEGKQPLRAHGRHIGKPAIKWVTVGKVAGLVVAALTFVLAVMVPWKWLANRTPPHSVDASRSLRDAGWSRWEESAGGNGHWYKAVAVSGGISWTEADLRARAEGAYLATITCASENEFVFDLVASPSFFNHRGCGPLLGGFQRKGAPEHDEGWCWVTAEPWGFTRWGPEAPNGGPSEDRLQYRSGVPRTAAPIWNDLGRDDSNTSGYVMERGDKLVPAVTTRKQSAADLTQSPPVDLCRRLENAGWCRWEKAAGGNGHWYKAVVVSNGISWTDADLLARAEGGYLATIASASENEFVFNLVASPPFFNRHGSGPLLGGFQRRGAPEHDEGWGWVNGEPWSFTRWCSGAPNGDVLEDRLQYHSGVPRTPSPNWNDVGRDDSNTSGYVIEGTGQLVAAVVTREGASSTPELMAAGGLPVSLRDGLVLHYDFDRDDGIRATDLSGNGNHGQVHGATWIAGGAGETDTAAGGAYQFDGVDDFIVIKNHPSLNPSSITLGAWVKYPRDFAGMGSGDPILIKMTHSPSGRSPYYQYRLAGVGSASSGRPHTFGFGQTFQDDVWTPSGFWTTGKWYFVTGTYDNRDRSLRLYVNGKRNERETVQAAGPLPQDYGQDIYIAKSGTDPHHIPCMIDEVVIYDRALSADEVKALYDALAESTDTPGEEVPGQSADGVKHAGTAKLIASSSELSEDPSNLIASGSFENESGGAPLGWTTLNDGHPPRYEYVHIGRTGSRCVSIRSVEGSNGSWITTADVKPHSNYRLSGWIKTDIVVSSVGVGARLAIHGQPFFTSALKGTRDWTRVEIPFNSHTNESLRINCQLDSRGSAAGQAWFDDIELVEIPDPSLVESDEPVNVLPLNSSYEDAAPHLGSDPTFMVFESTRPGGKGQGDLYAARRPTTDSSWTMGRNLTEINTAYHDSVGALRKDGLELIVCSTLGGGKGKSDFWCSQRKSPTERWSSLVHMDVLSSADWDTEASLSSDGLTIYFGSHGFGDPRGDLYTARRPSLDSPFGPPEKMVELNTPFTDSRPTVSEDGLTILFHSLRPGGKGGGDIWYAFRSSTSSPWSTPRNLERANSPYDEGFPAFGPGETELYFISHRPGGLGNSDIWLLRDPLKGLARPRGGPPQVPGPDVPHFADIQLEAAVRRAVGKNTGELTAADLAATNFTHLSADGLGITDLAGLQWCTNLTTLHLGGNKLSNVEPLNALVKLDHLRLNDNPQLSEIRPLGALTNLTSLSIWKCKIRDITPLAELKALRHINIWGNPLASLGPLSGLANLEDFYAGHAGISDISPLRTLTSLRDLQMGNNRIKDITPLATCTNLFYLDLNYNRIEDVSPILSLRRLERLELFSNNIRFLPKLEGFPVLTFLEIGRNPLSDVEALSCLTSLERLGVSECQIEHLSPLHELTHLRIVYAFRNKLTDLDGLENCVDLRELHVANNHISDIEHLRNLRDLTTISIYGNQISSIAALSNLTSLCYADLNANQITNVLPLANCVLLQDLRIGHSSPTNISVLANLRQLTRLHINDCGLTSLSPLSNLLALQELIAGRNAIEDIEPLRGLARLTDLRLDGNGITDVSPAADLKELTRLQLGENRLEDVSSLSNLRKLRVLYLYGNHIDDIGALASHALLTDLSLQRNRIDRIDALAGLGSLRFLDVSQNRVSDISPLATLEALPILRMDGNSISNITALADMVGLKELLLRDNRVRDISPLTRNRGIGVGDAIHLDGNFLSAQSLERDIPILRARGAGVSYTETVLIDDDAVLQSEHARLQNHGSLSLATDKSYIGGWRSTNSWVSWQVRFEKAGKYSVHVARYTPIAGGGEYEVTIGEQRLHGIANRLVDVADEDRIFTPVHLGSVRINEAAEYVVTIVPVRKTSSMLMDLQGVRLRRLSDTGDREQESAFPDERLESVIRRTIGKNTGELTAADLGATSFTNLTARAANIHDTRGLESCTNLAKLDLSGNRIDDLSPLRGLSRLRELRMDGNPITNLQPLSGLTNLTALAMRKCLIADISPLENCTRITELLLDENRINDIFVIQGMQSLTKASFSKNRIHQIPILKGLPELKSLSLSWNRLTGAEGLCELKSLERLGIADNAIPDLSPLRKLKRLKGLWAARNRFPTLTGLEDAHELENLGLEQNGLIDISALKNHKQLQSIVIYGNKLSDLSPLSGLTALRHLDAGGNRISDLSPLASCTKLSDLRLWANPVSRLDPLAKLPQLVRLHLGCKPPVGDESISDLTPLAGLTSLTELWIGGSRVADLEPLRGMGRLTKLQLDNARLTDLVPIADLTHLRDIHLRCNQITNIQALAGLASVKMLILSTNEVQSLSPLLANPGLGPGDTVKLDGNPLSKEAVEKQIPALKARGVDVSYAPVEPRPAAARPVLSYSERLRRGREGVGTSDGETVIRKEAPPT